MSVGPSTKWWGWGWEGKTYDLERRPDFWPYVVQRLQLPAQVSRLPVPLAAISLSAARLDEANLLALAAAIGTEHVRTDSYTRLAYAMGKSYRDLVRVRRGEAPNPPDAVVFPADAEHVQRVLAIAGREHLAVVPFGGGSSVVGSGDKPQAAHHRLGRRAGRDHRGDAAHPAAA